MDAKEFLQREVGETHYNPNIDNELMAELLDKYAQQRYSESSPLDTIVSRTCRWDYSEFEDAYDTECNHLFSFIADGIDENNFEYCPFCRGKITVE